MVHVYDLIEFQSIQIIVLLLFMAGVEDMTKVNQNATLAELGMDSLMGVEVKQLLERECDLNLPMTDIRKLTFERLQSSLKGK